MEPMFGRLSFVSVKKINVTRRWETYQQAQQLKQQRLRVTFFKKRTFYRIQNKIFQNYLLNSCFSIEIVTDLKCYYCNSQDEQHSECTADEDGELISCQYDDSKAEHYGNACIVGHTGNTS